MRIPCFVVIFLFGGSCVHAQSTKWNDSDANSGVKILSGKGVAASRRVAASPIIFKNNEKSSEFSPSLPDPFRIPNAQLETVNWIDLSGWNDDNHIAAYATFLNSCRAIVRSASPRHENLPLYAALKSVCSRALNAPPHDVSTARYFFESNFRPMRIAPLGVNSGLVTGYYEPTIEGSRVQSAKFNVPLYRTPPDLVNYEPGTYHDRTAIENGALAGRNLEICWLKDQADLLSAQIEGSVRVRLEDGKVLRLSYSGHNGWPFLADRETAPKAELSPGKVSERNPANPKDGKTPQRSNKSYVFFRETNLAEHEEPFGAQGISLTPGRSIATDKNIHVYGTPFFIDAKISIDREKSATKFQRLMVSQDTGGAIVGAARADLYVGSGNGPAHVAGRIHHAAQFTILVPIELDPVIAGARTPLPRPRPAFSIIEEKPIKTSEKRIP